MKHALFLLFLLVSANHFDPPACNEQEAKGSVHKLFLIYHPHTHTLNDIFQVIYNQYWLKYSTLSAGFISHHAPGYCIKWFDPRLQVPGISVITKCYLAPYIANRVALVLKS